MSDTKFPLKVKVLRPDIKQHCIQWLSSLPFVENKKAMLVHRPMAVATHTLFKKPHISVRALCGNSFTGTDKFTFLSTPPEESILCARCEEIALHKGLPSASLLAGRHVHIGGLKAFKTCGCDEE